MYAKIFQQIFDSSIADDYKLRQFFVDLIVLADSDGVVNMTPTAISARTRVPIEEVQAHLKTLSSPDPESQTPDAEGRRIELLDEHRTWGWHIINYHKFREIASEEQRKEKTRQRVRKFRESRECNAPVTQCNAPVTLANDLPYVSPSPSVQERECEGKPTIETVLFEADRIGLAKWKATDWFNEMEGCGWLDHNKRMVVRWQNILARVKVKWEADGRPSGPPKSKFAVSPNGEKTILQKDVERRAMQIKRLCQE